MPALTIAGGGLKFGGIGDALIQSGTCGCGIVALSVEGGGLQWGGAAIVKTWIVGGGLRWGGSACFSVPSDCFDGYAGVWLLAESGDGTAGEYKDSSRFGLNGTGGGGVAAWTPTLGSGVFCRPCQVCDGARWIAVPADAVIPTSPATISGWVNLSSLLKPRTLFARGGTTWSMSLGWTFLNQLQAAVQSTSGGSTVTVLVTSSAALLRAQWYHIAVVWIPGQSLTIFVNGVQVATVGFMAESLLTPSGGDAIGQRAGAQMPVGSLQDVRLSYRPRNAAWLKAEHDNYCVEGFYVVGCEIESD